MAPAMPPPVIPLPDPKYLRPAIHPRTAEMHRAFQQVCASGDSESVTNLVNAEPRNVEYLTEGLLAAVYRKHVRIVEYLLDQGAVIDRAVANAAGSVRSLDIFRLLLERGWDINAPVMGNDTVMLGVLDDESLVKWFLDHGAHTNLTPQVFNSPAGGPSTPVSATLLDLAATRCSTTAFDMLLDHGATKESSIPLHMAAGAGPNGERTSMISHLIGLGFDVNGSDGARGQYGIGTPLHYAITARSLENAKCLLDHGADAHKSVGLAGSPLKMAERNAPNDLVALLRGAS